MNAEAQRTASPEAVSGAILARIEPLSLALGGLGTLYGAWRWDWRGAVGIAVGVALSWINFRWLKGSVRTFGSAAANLAAQSAGASPETAPPVRATKSAYFKFLGRYVLLLGGVYVILTRTSLPAVAVFVGLFAVPAAVIAGAVYELVSSGVRHSFGREA